VLALEKCQTLLLADNRSYSFFAFILFPSHISSPSAHPWLETGLHALLVTQQSGLERLG
jgi:hypothetical protein